MLPLPFTPDLDAKPEVVAFFDAPTNALSYIVHDPGSAACAVIDPVLNFDPASGRVSTEGADAIVAHIRDCGWRLDWLIETHMHADHLTASAHILAALGGRQAIGRNVAIVQKIFGEVFNAGPDFACDGSQFDLLFNDGDSYAVGGLVGHAIDVPGHTPACMAHVIGDAVFVGDTLFMPDGGTARVDFRGGSATQLYRSIRRLLQLPDAMRVFVCHDYGPGGRPISWQSSIGAERTTNIHVRDGVGESAFVAMRTARDATLPPPRLIIPSLQVNMRAGRFPPPESDGRVYLKMPLGQF